MLYFYVLGPVIQIKVVVLSERIEIYPQNVA